MAGVKGRSGGSRPNTGGKREGAGRKPKGAVRYVEVAPAAPIVEKPVATMKTIPATKLASDFPLPPPFPGAKATMAPTITTVPATEPIGSMTDQQRGEALIKLLEQIALGQVDANATQVSAAKGILPYLIQKPGEKGKKEKVQENAERTTGRFGLRAVK